MSIGGYRTVSFAAGLAMVIPSAKWGPAGGLAGWCGRPGSFAGEVSCRADSGQAPGSGRGVKRASS
jgi:hypothetical protein